MQEKQTFGITVLLLSEFHSFHRSYFDRKCDSQSLSISQMCVCVFLIINFNLLFLYYRPFVFFNLPIQLEQLSTYRFNKIKKIALYKTDWPSGKNMVRRRAVPANNIQPHWMTLRPQTSRVSSRKVYAGYSTAPEIRKLIKSLPAPRLEVFHDSP